MVLLMADNMPQNEESIKCTDYQVTKYMCGTAHLLHAQSTKAKRISYSTSHGETLAAITGLESSTMVSTRLAEVTYGSVKPTLLQLLAVQEKGSENFPVDAYTDCRDFFELCTGHRALPQDKSQRIYIMVHREARAAGRLRWIGLIPTECMTSDALTKTMTSSCLMELLTAGRVRYFNAGHNVELKKLPELEDFDEEDLIEGDNKLMAKRKKETKKADPYWCYLMGAPLLHQPRGMLLYGMVTMAASTATDERRENLEDTGHVLLYIAIAIVIGTLMMEHVLKSVLKKATKKRTDAETQTQRREHLDTFIMQGNTTSRTYSTTTRPESLVVTRSGSCYHKKSCGHIQNRVVTSFQPCKDCIG